MTYKTNTIQYTTYIRRLNELERIQDMGVELIYSRNIIKITLGGCLVGLGVVTLPIPCGSIIMISIGISLLISGGVDMLGIWDTVKRKLRRITQWMR